MIEQQDSNSMIRAFIAVPVGEDVRRRLVRLQSTLAARTEGVRWVDPENIHLTLVFLGDIPGAAAESISSGLDSIAAGTVPLMLEARGLGFFGSRSSPRVIWVALSGDLLRLARMQQVALESAQAAGCTPDVKPFSPHLTIGRVRSNRDSGRLVAVVEKEKDACISGFIVESILLMKSCLTPKGPVYSILHEARFTGSAGGGGGDDDGA